MNTWQHASTINLNAYYTWSQDELTSPLGETFFFPGYHGGMIDHNTRRVLISFPIIEFITFYPCNIPSHQ